MSTFADNERLDRNALLDECAIFTGKKVAFRFLRFLSDSVIGKSTNITGDYLLSKLKMAEVVARRSVIQSINSYHRALSNARSLFPILNKFCSYQRERQKNCCAILDDATDVLRNICHRLTYLRVACEFNEQIIFLRSNERRVRICITNSCTYVI